MKKMIILLLSLSITSTAPAAVSARVYLHDGITPLELADPCIPDEYRDVMVGTKLTVIITSNIAEEGYSGSLVLQDAEMENIGLIYGRDFNYPTYPGSCLPDAGEYAVVWDAYPGPGFEMNGGFEPNAGDWFIFDYNALDIGNCQIELRDFDAIPELIQTLSLNHVPTRDFDGNTQVDFADFAILASYWLENNCEILDNCEGANLDNDGDVDLDDLMKFCEYWLKKTE